LIASTKTQKTNSLRKLRGLETEKTMEMIKKIGSIDPLKKLRIISLILLALPMFGMSCKKDPAINAVEFKKSDLLHHIGTDLIVPEYQQLLEEINLLETKYIQFSNDKTHSLLEEVKAAWKIAYQSWYSVNIYEFGPAMNIGLRNAVGVFPTDTVKILDNINAGTYVLGSAANTDAIGFSSFDFLLYRTDALSYFASATYTQYGLEVLQKIKTEVAYVVSNWNSNYLNTFKNSTGTESTSSFSLFVNEFNKVYELAKNAKLGIPIGKQSLGIQRPEYIEARKSTISLELLAENMKSLHRIFKGNTKNGAEGIGFDDYLIALDKQTLAHSIDSQFSSITMALNALTLSLEQEMTSHPQALDQLYTKMQNLVISIKTDMASSFGVLITYQDNDGD
jgi:uncharacterized protein